jgi:hypothetical protein
VALLCAALIAITAVGCFEWTEDSQGHLKSVGVPGVPIWKAKTADAQAPAGQTAKAAPLDPAQTQLELAASVPTEAWLGRLNHYRAISGLPPVSQNLALNVDCVAHANYLVQQMPTDQRELLIYRHSVGAEAIKRISRALITQTPAPNAHKADGACPACLGPAIRVWTRSNQRYRWPV